MTMWEIIQGNGQLQECCGCGYIGTDHAETDSRVDATGENDVFCPVCHSTEYYLLLEVS